MTDDYDAADNARKCYDVAIAAMREKLHGFRQERIGDCNIYVLVDPRTGLIRYVGKTVRSLDDRLRGHLADAKRRSTRRVARWINTLLRDGLRPEICSIEVVSSGGDWVEREKYYIKLYRDMGNDLTNLSDGGEGLSGYKFSTSTIKARSEKRRKGSTFYCETCGISFWRRPSDIKNGNNRFCSRNCYSMSLKGIYRPVPAECTKRGIAAAANEKVSRTHCKRGHLLCGDNMFRTSHGSRGCKECRKLHKRTYRARCANVEA